MIKIIVFCDPLSVESVAVRAFNKTEQLALNQLAELSREGLVSVSRRQLADAEGADGVSTTPNRKKSVDRAVSSPLAASILLETESGVSLSQDNTPASNDNFCQ